MTQDYKDLEEQGLTGERGLKGDTGQKGVDGKDGLQGPCWGSETGPQGPQGLR